ESLPLPQQERVPLLLGHLLERIRQADQLVGVELARRQDVLDRVEVAGALDPPPPPRGALARQTDVVGELVQAGRLELRGEPAVPPRGGNPYKTLADRLRAAAMAASASERLPKPRVATFPSCSRSL